MSVRPFVDDDAPVDVPRAGRLVAGADMTRFHRADCPLVAGKRVSAAGREAHVRAGRGACGVCLPTDPQP